jgi:glycosyltransferase involved in cell wall biosynthesis
MDLDGKTLVSCSRPKLIVEQVEALRRKGVKVRLHCLLHDMIPLHEGTRPLPKFASNFLHDNQAVISAADVIIANSDFTRSEIEDFLKRGLLPSVKRLETVPLAHEFALDAECSSTSIPTDPYFLTVGATLGRKNLEAILAAYVILSSRSARLPRLVIAGALRKRTLKYIAHERFDHIRSRIEFRDSPLPEELAKLYMDARALIISSRMEGWGLPAGEALWFGTPVICSTAPVFNEVCRQLGLFFDPDQPEELARIMQMIDQDLPFRESVCESIRRAKPVLRTWSDVARDILSITSR